MGFPDCNSSYKPIKCRHDLRCPVPGVRCDRVPVHDEQLPEDLQPANDIDPSGTGRPDEGAENADDQLGQVGEGTQTASHADAAATDTPGTVS